MRRQPPPKYMRDFFMRRYGRIFPVAQTATGQIIHAGDEVRLRADHKVVWRVVCFFYSDNEEIAFGFVEPENYDPLAPMWEQESLLKLYEKAH